MEKDSVTDIRGKIDLPTKDLATDTVGKTGLPTEFRSVDRAGDPHIVGTKTEHIAVPEACEGCNADIVLSMDGASKNAIIELNHALTGWVFSEDKDIRIPSNRKLASDVAHVDGLQSGILYADSGIVTFFMSIETDYAGAAHPNRDLGSYNTFVLSQDGKKFDRAVILGDNESKVLEHFYPNGSKLLEEASAEFDESCYEPSDFPNEFHAQLRPGSDGEQVVFAVDFEYGRIVSCGGLVEIAIPISDIMREVPQYVPEDSVLRRFK